MGLWRNTLCFPHYGMSKMKSVLTGAARCRACRDVPQEGCYRDRTAAYVSLLSATGHPWSFTSNNITNTFSKVRLGGRKPLNICWKMSCSCFSRNCVRVKQTSSGVFQNTIPTSSKVWVRDFPKQRRWLGTYQSSINSSSMNCPKRRQARGSPHPTQAVQDHDSI